MDNKLQELLNRDDCYFIHYASNGFYNGSSPAPKISCIIIWNNKTQEKYKFDIQDHLTGNSLEQAEKDMLAHFKTLFEKRPNVCFIHWNMLANGFGFKAIQARAKDFDVDIPILDNNRMFDLASYIEYLAGKKLSIKQIFWFNSLLNQDFLDGKIEAEYFEQKKFEQICNSVHSKVMALSFVVEEIQEGTLKTEKPFAEPNDGLTKEERHREAVKRSQMREQMLKDIREHNKRVMEEPEIIYEDYEIGIFDPAHPLLSLFCNWFANRK